MSRQTPISQNTRGQRLALLIDADNAQASLIDEMLVEASKYGSVTIRRAYGDWTQQAMIGWKQTLQLHAIQPIQQFRYTVGKNATDSALIIDAMDILHSGVVDGFCIVSSDSDFTRLATRIREGGYFVMGIGRQQTPRSLISACEVFVFTELLAAGAAMVGQPTTAVGKGMAAVAGGDKGGTPAGVASVPAAASTTSVSIAAISVPVPTENGAPVAAFEPAAAVQLLRQAWEIASGEDGWAHLGAVGQVLLRLNPGFDARSYGCKRLSLLVRALPRDFEVREVRSSGEGAAVLLIRPRSDPSPG